jgi:hypothetical protein
MEALRQIITNPPVLALWVVTAAAAVAVLVHDLWRKNPEIPSLMKAVWLLTVVYSGLLGLAVYWMTGRKQIPRDGPWRRAARSTAHCYSGCGMGEIIGIVIAAGLLSLTTWGVAAITFTLAYLFGFTLTFGPLVQEGVPVGTALSDAFYSESASIVVMEAVAITVDIVLAGAATMGEALFWASLAVSLSCGLIAAWPVNYLLIRRGVKEGMHDPREMAKPA